MKKLYRNVALVLGILASLAAFGCSGKDEKKPEAKPDVKVEQKAEASKAEAPKPKVKPVPKSKLYIYAVHLDDEDKVPPMTDEVIKKFEELAKDVKMAPKDAAKGTHGVFVFNSGPQPKNSGAQIYTYRWTAEMPGHHDSTFENDKGKKINEQHYTHIDMTVDKETNKLLRYKKFTYDVDKATGEKGKSVTIVEKQAE